MATPNADINFPTPPSSPQAFDHNKTQQSAQSGKPSNNDHHNKSEAFMKASSPSLLQPAGAASSAMYKTSDNQGFGVMPHCYPPPYLHSHAHCNPLSNNLLHSLPDLGLKTGPTHLDSHMHRHPEPPFIRNVYPYMPIIGNSPSATVTKLSSITMPSIENDNSKKNDTSNKKREAATETVIGSNQMIQSSSDVESCDANSSTASTSSSSSSSCSSDGDDDDEDDSRIGEREEEEEEEQFRRKRMKSNENESQNKNENKIKKENQTESGDTNTKVVNMSGENHSKSLTGIWVVHYTHDIIRDFDITKPRYEMELAQSGDGDIEGKCIEGSGPAAWSFLLTGKLEKERTFKCTMHGEDDEIFVKATFDENDIIKNGMWYHDRLYLRKGGNLVAARKGTTLPKALMQNSDSKVMVNRKRDASHIEKRYDSQSTANQKGWTLPPSKRQKRNDDHNDEDDGDQAMHSGTNCDQNKNNGGKQGIMQTYQSSGPVTRIDGRTIPPEHPPKPKIKTKGKLKAKARKSKSKVKSKTKTKVKERRGRQPKTHETKQKEDGKKNVIVDNVPSDSSEDVIVKCRSTRRFGKNKKKHKQKKQIIKPEQEDKTFPPAIPLKYHECDLTGAWSLYFDNSVSVQPAQNSSDEQHHNSEAKTDPHELEYEDNHAFDANYLADYYESDDEPINDDTLFLSHNRDTNELAGFLCSPLKCHATGNVSPDGLHVRLILIWSLDKELSGKFAGHVTVINGKYDCDGGLNCEYCVFHCTSYFHAMLWRQQQIRHSQQGRTLTESERISIFQQEIERTLNETKYNNARYVSIVQAWFQENETDVSPGQIHGNIENNYSNQCIWRRRKLPVTDCKCIDYTMFIRKQNTPPTPNNLPEFMLRHHRISKNSSNFFFGDLVQLFITYDAVLSHPISCWIENDGDNNYDVDDEFYGIEDSKFEEDIVSDFGSGRWVDGIVINIYEGKVLVRYLYQRGLYQQWIDCDINRRNQETVNSKRKAAVQPMMRLRQNGTFSPHLNYVAAQLNINALTEWRLNLNKSSVCFAWNENGEWAQAAVKRRFGCFVFIHWLHYAEKYDQYLSIHSHRIQPLRANDLCNRFRMHLNFENVLRIKRVPHDSKHRDSSSSSNCRNTQNSKDDDFELIDKIPKSTALSNIFGSFIFHLPPQ